MGEDPLKRTKFVLSYYRLERGFDTGRVEITLQNPPADAIYKRQNPALGAFVSDSLPAVGELVHFENTYWTVAGVLRRLDPLDGMKDDPIQWMSARVILLDHCLLLDEICPYLFVGLEDGLVGVIGYERVFRLLWPVRASGLFNWGYLGTGPWYLAEAILYHITGNKPEASQQKSFTLDILNPLLMNTPMVIRPKDIALWLEAQKKQTETEESETEEE